MSGLELLSPQLLYIASLIRDGEKNLTIATKIQTTEFVVKNHVREIYDLLGLDNRVQLALWFETYYGSGSPPLVLYNSVNNDK